MRIRVHPLAAVALAMGTSVAVPAAAQTPRCEAPPPVGAESLLAAGRYWHALRASPPLPPPHRPLDPEAALLEIRIAEGVGEYGRVESILRRVRGTDTIPELLAAAARQDERARRWGAAAARYRRLAGLRDAGPALHAAAVVRLAVVSSRLGQRQAAEAWWRAGEELPVLVDWFAVRLAQLEPDTGLAAAAVAGAATPGAARAADSVLARRREAVGDLEGALAIYLHRGRALDAARVEMRLGRTDSARARVDSVLLADPSRPEAADAARLFAAWFRHPATRELLGVGRAWAARGRLRMAERWVERAVLPRDTALEPRLELAELRSREGRVRAALAVLDDAARARRASAPAPPAITRARIEVLGAAGRWEEAGTLASGLALAAPGDSDAAAALLVMAEHQRAAGALAEERALYGALRARFAATPAAARARLQMALSEYVAGRRDTAAAWLGAPAGDSASRQVRALRYWAGRIGVERRDPAAAAGLRALADQNPTDFYGVRARELLGDSLSLPPDTAPPPLGAYPASRARERVILLAKVGLDDEARAEAMGWLQAPGPSAPLLVEVAGAAAAMGFGREAILIAEAARRRIGLTRGVAQGLFPYMYRSVIEAEAAEQCVDPLLMAAIIRQESRFEPRARSRAGARGMSQVMPVTGAELSRRLRLGPWNPNFLYLPDFNLHLGAVYVRDRERRDSLSVYALIASYIAGRGGVLRWRGRPGFQDLDLFAERLSSSGIRDYVRNVYANYAWYRRLYGAAAPAGP